MSQRILIVDTPEEGQVVLLDFASMTQPELLQYVSLGYEEALDEYFARDPRADQKLDPYSPVVIPEN
jgi:hypothetical protein